MLYIIALRMNHLFCMQEDELAVDVCVLVLLLCCCYIHIYVLLMLLLVLLLPFACIHITT